MGRINRGTTQIPAPSPPKSISLRQISHELIRFKQALIRRNVPLRLELLNLMNTILMTHRFLPVVPPSGSGGKFGSLSEPEEAYSR